MAFQNITVECRGCGASISLDPTVRFGTCPYCGNCNSLVPAPNTPPPPAVEEIYQAHYSKEAFRSAVRAYLCSSPDVPDELYSTLSEREFTLNFWPFYRHTISWTANWSADIGYDNEDAKEGVSWSPGSGQVLGESVVYAPASSILCNRGLAADGCALASKNREQSFYFQPESLSGIAYLACDLDAQAVENDFVAPKLNDLVEDGCIDQLPGEYQKNLHCNSRIDGRKTVLQLIPYWLFVYEYEGGSYYVMQNAVTGEVTGTLPKTSKRKVTSWLLTAIAVLLTAVFAGLMDLMRSHYDALMVVCLSFPTLCAGFIYRDAIARKKAKLKTVPMAEMTEQLEKLKSFESRFVKLGAMVIAGWCAAAMILTFILALLIPIWGEPDLSDMPEEPKYPQEEVSGASAAKSTVIRLKKEKVPGIEEQIESEDGETFVIEK